MLHRAGSPLLHSCLLARS
ncbi:hypothetical protein Nmel_004086 [Mimus melanotis]